MTRTARRRWSREFQGEIDGVHLGRTGPVFIHGYDPPAGGKWIDSVIPGKLGAYHRGTGETLWVSPCEVGYGRGFGSGLGEEDDIVVLGPSINKGYRIVRMSISSGELVGAREIEAFDQALVAGDMCVTVTPARVAGILTSAMVEVWAYSRDGERYHQAGRDGDQVLVVYTDTNLRRQGVLALDVEDGESHRVLLAPELPVIHEIVVGEGAMVLLTGSRTPAGRERLALRVFATRTEEPYELWHRDVPNESTDELPDVSLSLDSGKLYVANGALLRVLDVLSGRELGEVALPGLDERIAWQISEGAGLLAEETRASVFEIPA